MILHIAYIRDSIVILLVKSVARPLREEFPRVIDRAYSQYKSGVHVQDIMTKKVITVSTGASMQEAARTMGSKHIGSLIVEEGDRHIGIVTERDLLSRVLAKGSDPQQVKVEDVMSWPLASIKPIATVKEAARHMIKHKSRLVVYEEGKAVGIITASDLVRTIPECPETECTVERFMTKRIVTVKPDTAVKEVVGIMGIKRIGSVLVEEARVPHGIFTERDLLSKLIAKQKSLNTTIDRFASKPLATIPQETSVHQAAKTMARKHMRRLPVTEKAAKGKRRPIVGIITARDLVEAYAA